MAWPDSQARRTKLTIPSSVVSGSGILTDFPVLVTRVDLSDEMCSPTSPNRAQSDGGDLAAALGDDGTSRLALDVVAFEYDSTDGAGDAVIEIWVKLDVSGTANTEFYIGYNTSGTSSQPAVSDPYGRNAVWSDYLGVWHLLDGAGTTALDSTGNGGDGTLVGSVSWVDGPFGGAAQIAAASDSTNRIEIPSDYSGNSAWTFQMFLYPDTWDTQYQTIAAHGPSTEWRFARSSNSTTDLECNNDVRDIPLRIFGTLPSEDSWHSFAYRQDAAGISTVLDGAPDVAAGSGLAVTSNLGPFYVGNLPGYPRGFHGAVAEVRLSSVARSDDWLATEYANQNDPASFVTVGTPTDVGGGGPDYTLTAAAGNYTYTGYAASLKAGRKLTAGAGSYTYTGYDANLVYTPTGGPTYTLSADAGSYTYTGNAAGLKASRKLTADAGSYSYTGYAAGLSRGYVLAAGSGSYTYTGYASNLKASRKLTAAPGAYIYTGYDATLRYSNQSLWTVQSPASTSWAIDEPAITIWTEQ